MSSRGGNRKSKWLYIFVVAAMMGLLATGVSAESAVGFHGYFESNMVMRDQNGIQYGFLDHLNGVQQRNTLKFDVSINPDLKGEDFAVQKFQITFRGAYDSIFDLRANKYGDITENIGASRFDYGLKDIRFESDLREAFIDFTYGGPLGSAFFRPGRQLVSWGESSANATLLDVICPKDQSYQLFFQNPDDVAIPLWMARLNYSAPPIGGLRLNLDLLWVPDIRPSQFGPLDSVALNPTAGMNAPYVSILPFAAFRGLDVRQDVPTNKQEYGAKLTADIGLLSLSMAYYRDVNNDPATVLTDFITIPGVGMIPTKALLTHPTQDVYGAYFSYQISPLDLVLRGEIAQHSNQPVTLAVPELKTLAPMSLATYRMKPVTLYMVAIDKNIYVRWITSHEPIGFSLEWIHQKINSWDSAFNHPEASKAGSPVRDMDIIGFNMSWSWWQGRISPLIAAAYNPGRSGAGGGSGYIHPTVSWQISSNLYANMGLHAFLGDKTAKSGFAGLVGTSELTLKMGYEW
ncbi:MAG: DUF1302 family protein [Pseudomonadota bacterium]